MYMQHILRLRIWYHSTFYPNLPRTIFLSEVWIKTRF